MRRALVTGASGGIGAAIARRLGADGHHVLIHANRNPKRAAVVLDEMRRGRFGRGRVLRPHRCSGHHRRARCNARTGPISSW
jgi:NAD(P)-dependent dehydrogenase (short-subunit alcohol dehydrogenase family)